MRRLAVTAVLLAQLAIAQNNISNSSTAFTVNLGNQPDVVVAGTISATDIVVAAPAGDGTSVTGTPTAGSAVFIAATGGGSAWNLQISGTATGTYYFEGSVDSTNGSDGLWYPVNGRQTGIVNTVLGYSVTTGGFYRGNPSGLKYFRVRNKGGTTPSNPISIRLAAGVGAVFLNASIPSGTNTIGSVKLTDGTTVATVNSAATQAAATANGALLTEKGARWRVTSTPAVSVVASAVKAAGATGVRHVADCITFSAGSTTAPVLTKLNINLRDGAAGAGTIIWSYTVVIPAATGQNVAPYSVCGLNLPGTAATAMTLEFSALLTNLFEDASISGYDVN